MASAVALAVKRRGRAAVCIAKRSGEIAAPVVVALRLKRPFCIAAPEQMGFGAYHRTDAWHECAKRIKRSSVGASAAQQEASGSVAQSKLSRDRRGDMRQAAR